MTDQQRTEISLLALRLTVFLVMFMWTIAKFAAPEVQAGIFESYYGIGGLDVAAMYVIAALELVIILAFVAGAFKRYSYGLVLIFHAVSTLSSYEQYLNPADGANMLYFAAWPMLGACLALYLMRHRDNLFALHKG